MRKISILALALLIICALPVKADPVPQSRALEIATKILSSQPATKAGGSVRLVWDGEEVGTKVAVNPAFYVFTRDGGGFVIISGDDNVTPVLAISDRNDFRVEGMPDNVRWWMDQMKAYVRSARVPSREVRNQWAELADTKSTVSGLISSEFTASQTVEWSQGAPFNAKTPTVTGQSDQAVTGCLPLAMAEILTWFGYPTTGIGTLNDYTYTYYADDNTEPWGYTINGYVLSTTYQWANLKSLKTVTDCQNASSDLKDNLAQLIYDCGVMIEANYNSGAKGGTSASDSKVVKAFGTYMGYNKAAKVVLASDYSSRAWNDLMKAQVNEHPVLYCGYAPASEGNNDASHAYVLDGYAKCSGDDVFHFNFGWGGWCNGYYYSLFSQSTDEGYDFNTNLRALIDFYPDNDPEHPSAFVPDIRSCYYDETHYGLQYVDPFSVGSMYRISFTLYNAGADTYSGKLKVKLLDKNDSFKADVDIYVGNGGWTDRVESVVPGQRIWSQLYLLIDAGASVTFGDRIALYYSTDEAETVFVPLVSLDGCSSVDKLPVIPAAFIKVNDSYNKDDWFEFRLTNHDYIYPGTVWTITDPDGVSVVKNQSEREFQLTKAGTYKIRAAVAATVGGTVTETIETYITVN